MHQAATEFVAQITDVLEKMPRELVMIFKTNDLLRGLDARLKTSAASASFISMSKSCLRAVYEEEYVKCDSMTSRWRLYSKLKWNEMRLLLYQFSLSSPSSRRLMLADAVSFMMECVLGLLKSLNNLPKLVVPGVT